MSGFLCHSGKQFRFRGFNFEWHSYSGPGPIDESGHPTNREPPSEFWVMIKHFQMLDEEEQREFLVRRGGCVPLESPNCNRLEV